MQVGLVRHFKIRYRKSQWIDSEGYAAFLRWYDEQEGQVQMPALPTAQWQQCYCSDMRRAKATAAALAAVPATPLTVLREVPQAPLFATRIRMPLVVWHTLSRIGWWFNHASQLEGRRASEERVARIVDWLLAQPEDQTVLVVTHGFLMYILRRALKRASFEGHIPLHPQCGDVYLHRTPIAVSLTDARGETECLPRPMSH